MYIKKELGKIGEELAYRIADRRNSDTWQFEKIWNNFPIS